MQLSVDLQSYGEHSVTDDSDTIQKECNKEISRAREILRQTDEIMKSVESETERNSNMSEKNTIRKTAQYQNTEIPRYDDQNLRPVKSTHCIHTALQIRSILFTYIQQPTPLLVNRSYLAE